MRLAISVATYFPEKNGVQFVTQKLAEGLVKDGHSVTVVTRMYEGCENKTNVHGVQVLRCDIKNRFMFHFGNKKEFRRILLEVSQMVDAIIFVCLESVAADWVLDIINFIPCQKVVYMHGMHEFKWKRIDFCGFRNFTFKILRDIRWGIFYTINKKKIGKFDKFIHLHEEDSAYKFFEKRYPGKNYVLENFAEDMFFSNEYNVYSIGDYYIYIANYHSGKNQLLLLEAFYLMKKDFKLVFIGSEKTKYYHKLIERKNELDIRYNKVKDVVFLCNISRNKLPLYLKNAYAFVMTSRSEHFPIAIIESLASGTPYISTDVGIVKFLPGGMIVSDDAEDIAKKMDWLLDDKKKYQKLNEKASNYAQSHFSFNNYILKFEKIVCVSKGDK